MFNKKPRRNFRQRKDDSSEEEAEKDNISEVRDNENVVNRPLKVPQSRGISCNSKREAPPTKSDSNNEEEEKRHRNADKNKTNTILSFSEEGGEAEFRLKKPTDKAVLFQLRRESSPTTIAQNSPPTSTSLSQKDYRGSEASPSSPKIDDSDDSDDNEGSADDKCDAEDNHEELLSPKSILEFSHQSGCKQSKIVIPTAKEIEAARRQRRANRAQKEYIPLDKDGHSPASSSPEHSSTKTEEDQDEDDDNELDDHERRIEFAPKPKTIRERIAEQIGDSDGSLCVTDEEQEIWEETQIEKGVKMRPGEQSPSGSESSCYSSSSRRERQRQKRSFPTPPSVTVSMIKKRISVKLDSLKEVHRARQAEFRRMQGDIENARCSAENLDESSLEFELRFYRDMTLYSHNLVECLREKIVEINSLELKLHAMLSDYMDSMLSHRRLRVREEADHLQQLSYKTDEQTADRKEIHSDSFIGKAEEDFNIPEDTQLSAEEEEQCQKQIDDILSQSQAVFADVKDDFFEVKKILSRFEEWRRSYSDSYHNAYISLCLPKLLHPIIRHQLLAWNPLKHSSEYFENMAWFTALETFCHGHGHEELEHTDRATLTNVIEKTLFPKITAYVQLVWDPVSLCQTDRLTDLCHKLNDDYSVFEGEPSKPVKEFIDAVISRLRSCVDEDIFIPLYPKRFLEDRSSPQRHFRDQQFWTAIKLLSIMGKWDTVLPESVLKELMIDKLLSRYLMIALSNSTQTTLQACKKIAESLPSSWSREENNCLPQLQTFRNYLVQMAHAICKNQSPKDLSIRSAVIEVLQTLSRIRCYDSILAIAEKYHYEDAIYTHQLLNQDSV